MTNQVFEMASSVAQDFLFVLRDDQSKIIKFSEVLQLVSDDTSIATVFATAGLPDTFITVRANGKAGIARITVTVKVPLHNGTVETVGTFSVRVYDDHRFRLAFRAGEERPLL